MGKSLKEIQAEAMAFLKKVEKLSGRKPIIYTDDHIDNSQLNKLELADYALWIAYPDQVTEPRPPAAWTDKD